ncbi:DUF3472 domain-containing protein [Tundrisphaera lichenicola]|uniref:DUF3472 domain-containing protein n=1 Tax=Tundrisphaera lichenicola TaxID=2029860 RepID=UPI003EB9A1BA
MKPTIRILSYSMAIVILCWGPAPSRADEKLEGIACRSVHLGYPAPEGVAFSTEVEVLQSAPGTFVMACGWNKGYFGLQELADGKKLLLFSVWDSEQNDPKAVVEDRRTKLVEKDEKMRIGRFGGEGTGGQAFYDYPWEVGKTYRLMVASKVKGQRTEYSGYFFEPEQGRWKLLVTFSTVTGGKDLGGYYSFLEDFRRNRVSATQVRRARFGKGVVRDREGKLQPLTQARFTADANPVTNIDAGIEDGRFFLATGGETRNEGAKLREIIKLGSEGPVSLPEDLPLPRQD